MKILFQSLSERVRPEDVAEMILKLRGNSLSLSEKALLMVAAAGSLKNRFLNFTSMLQEFAKPIGAQKQVDKALELFKLYDSDSIDANQPQQIRAFLRMISPIIHKEPGQNDYLSDRLNREKRAAHGIEISKRQYNKRWRSLRHIEKKMARLEREIVKREFQMIANHGLSHRISFADFALDLDSACFIAYYTARCNLRSEFTNGSQVRPFNTISKALYDRCNRNPASNWWAIAQVYPAPEVLARLSDTQKGDLLGTWTGVLQEIAQMLEETWNAGEFNEKTMVVRRGNDSSTWNNTAGAWNKARESWMNLIHAMGLDFILDEVCFGKVMRLMAADVVSWHKAFGGGLDPNTQIWASVPLPWEVFQGKKPCTRATIIEACKNAKVDPEKSGWIAPRIHGVAPFTPTPELVHGVSVGNPFLARALKKAGVFSGKSKKKTGPWWSMN